MLLGKDWPKNGRYWQFACKYMDFKCEGGWGGGWGAEGKQVYVGAQIFFQLLLKLRIGIWDCQSLCLHNSISSFLWIVHLLTFPVSPSLATIHISGPGDTINYKCEPLHRSVDNRPRDENLLVALKFVKVIWDNYCKALFGLLLSGLMKKENLHKIFTYILHIFYM